MPGTVTVVTRRRAGADSSVSSPVSPPAASAIRIRRCSDSSPLAATDTAAFLDGSPASTSRRKCATYPVRQLVSRSASSAPAGSAARSASAVTARPSADVLLRPSAEAGKTTPASSSPLIALLSSG